MPQSTSIHTLRTPFIRTLYIHPMPTLQPTLYVPAMPSRARWYLGAALMTPEYRDILSGSLCTTQPDIPSVEVVRNGCEVQSAALPISSSPGGSAHTGAPSPPWMKVRGAGSSTSLPAQNDSPKPLHTAGPRPGKLLENGPGSQLRQWVTLW